MKKTTILSTVLLLFIFSVARSQVTGFTFTSGAGTYTSVAGSSPVLTGDITDPVRDEGYANGIPLGFTFNYLGNNYTSISASTNGFAAFGTIATAAFSNNIATIGGAGKPVLAPLWEDLALANVTDLQYVTTGAAGSRIFILQWSNVLFDFGASAPSVSFQLRLYETTNVIEFIYNQLPAAVQDYSGGASIGITGASSGNGNYLSLNNSNASPVVSSSIATNNITAIPATGQIYTFTPPACHAPGGLTVTNITTTNATVSWADIGAASYEYAITTSATPPVSGTASSVVSLADDGLTPCTQYYLYVRRDCGGTFSGWNSLGFTTLCNAANVPYTMPVSNVISPALPVGTTVKDENQDGNTWRSYPSAGQGWTDQVVAYVYNTNCTTPANDWLFTQDLNLAGGTTYRLKFKYNNDFTSLYTEKLKVAYGTGATASAMTNILADYPLVSSATPKTVSIDFTPSASGIYYIGFQAYSDANKDVLILDDIKVDQRPSCEIPTALTASVQSSGISVDINWVAPATGTPTGYEYAVTADSTAPSSGTAIAAVSTTVNSLTANTKYYLHVRTNCGGTFSEWVCLAFATVVNDEVCKAITLTLGAAPVCGNTALATTTATDPYSNCSTPNNTVWYKYTAVANGTIVLHLTTPAAPARPLHGWVNWYTLSGSCPNVSFINVDYCSEFGNNGNNDADDLISPVLTAGTTYYIMIDGFSDEYGEFCISIPACSPALAVKVDNITGTAAHVNWKGTGTFILEYGPSGFTPGTGDAAGTGGTIINPAVSPQSITGLTLSTTYDVYVRQNCTTSNNGYSSNSVITTFTTHGPPPANDDCPGAIPLVVSNSACAGPTAGTTLNATPSATLPLPECGNGSEGYDDDVWYSFIPAAGEVAVDIEFALTGGNGDLVAQVYTSSDNTCSGTMTAYDCSDDDGPGNLPAFHNLPVTEGTVYFIRVFTLSKGVNSQFTICVFKALLPNDNASGARTLLVGEGCSGATYTNVGATQTAGEPAGTCSSTTGYATVWFKFDAPVGGAVRISTASGEGNTLTNTRLALFSTTDVNDYSKFSIIACDEDGGAAPFEEMSVLYATDLTPGTTYYIQVDKFDNATNTGTFCITVDKLSPSMLSPNTGCNMPNQPPAASIPGYTGWVSLVDENSKLMAMVRNTSGANAADFSIAQNIHTGAVRKDTVSGEYYLDRNYKIVNAASGNSTINVQLFFTDAELAALTAVDPAAAVSRLRVTKQTGTDCQLDFVAGNGTNSELAQLSNGTMNGINWIRVNSAGFSNFYIHSTRSVLTAKVFLQGAFSPSLSRHKDVTTPWANVLNTYALNQPYNIPAFDNYNGTESVLAGFFTSTDATTDIVDWVLLELKSITGVLVTRRAAFVREDGQIVDLDGISPVSFDAPSGVFYLTIRHRNHLGISTQSFLPFTSRALGVIPLTPQNFDFTTSTDANIFGDAAAYKIVGGKNVMIGGNANSNNTVRFGGLNNDVGTIQIFLGSVTAVVSNLYSGNDVNMDGTIRFGGLNNDVGWLQINALGGSTTAVVVEQKR